mmetsp:Transcript_26880/g.61990  ORF Transcript_26880/g.61990 Transcript_26880/m.61990 type:complete len:581 (-) Transcript_26880:221-1963(-)
MLRLWTVLGPFAIAVQAVRPSFDEVHHLEAAREDSNSSHELHEADVASTGAFPKWMVYFVAQGASEGCHEGKDLSITQDGARAVQNNVRISGNEGYQLQRFLGVGAVYVAPTIAAMESTLFVFGQLLHMEMLNSGTSTKKSPTLAKLESNELKFAILPELRPFRRWAQVKGRDEYGILFEEPVENQGPVNLQILDSELSLTKVKEDLVKVAQKVNEFYFFAGFADMEVVANELWASYKEVSGSTFANRLKQPLSGLDVYKNIHRIKVMMYQDGVDKDDKERLMLVGDPLFGAWFFPTAPETKFLDANVAQLVVNDYDMTVLSHPLQGGAIVGGFWTFQTEEEARRDKAVVVPFFDDEWGDDFQQPDFEGSVPFFERILLSDYNPHRLFKINEYISLPLDASNYIIYEVALGYAESQGRNVLPRDAEYEHYLVGVKVTDRSLETESTLSGMKRVFSDLISGSDKLKLTEHHVLMLSVSFMTREGKQAYVGWSSAFGDAVNSYHPTSYKLSTETAYELKDDRTIQVDIPESTEKRTITKYYVKVTTDEYIIEIYPHADADGSYQLQANSIYSALDQAIRKLS